ncbi:ketohexokinase [Drosophila eugracilis]|uniref:ketohexokinase n=1 Tax=Drosophila eugracilis TaxID=29029 RepID=UPI0007E87B53|nr:ketohexokinase [Drosophila eugracilis]
MKKQIIKEFITVKKVLHLPPKPEPPPPPPKRHVLVVGSCTLDMITIVDRPLTPGQVQRTTEGSWRRGGPASNICTVFRRLGLECEFLGVLSKVRAFESLLNEFQSLGIDISHCPLTNDRPAHRSIIVQRNADSRTILEYFNPNNELSYQQFVGAVDYQKYSWIHFECRNPVEMLRMIRAVISFNERCPESRIVLSVDLDNMRPATMLMASMADYVFARKTMMRTYAFMNGREVVWAIRDEMRTARAKWEETQPPKVPYYPPDPPSENSDEKCYGPNNQPIVIYNNYMEGASCLMADDTYFKVGSQIPQKIVDWNSVNDTFSASVIYALQKVKMKLRDALEYGTRASALKLTGNGFDVLRCMPKDLIGCYYA